MDSFDSAVKEKDTSNIVLILKKVELTDASITPILKQLGLDYYKSLGADSIDL